MAEKKTNKVESALVTGKSVAGNPNLAKILGAIEKGYQPHRIGQSMRDIRIDHTAMFENDKPIYAYREINGGAKVPRLLFRAGWYLSPEENYIKEQILADEGNLALNQAVWAQMENAGMTVEKSASEMEDAKVVATT